MATYTHCDLCNCDVPGKKREFNDHLKTYTHRDAARAKDAADRVVREKAEAIKHALSMIAYAKRPVLRDFASIKEVAAAIGVENDVVWALYREADRLSDKINEYKRTAERMIERLQTDVVDRINIDGSARLHGSVMSTSSYTDLPRLEASIEMMQRSLATMLTLTGNAIRLPVLEGPRNTAIYDRVAQIEFTTDEEAHERYTALRAEQEKQ